MGCLYSNRKLIIAKTSNYIKVLIGIYLIGLCSDIYGQSASLITKYADGFFKNGQYIKAIRAYKAVLEKHPNYDIAKYRLAESYRLTLDNQSAKEYYLGFVRREDKRFPLAGFHYASMRKNEGEYNQALIAFRNFDDFLKKNNLHEDDRYRYYHKQARIEIDGCQMALNLQKHQLPEHYFECLPKPVNSTFSDYAAISITSDSVLCITSARKGGKGNLADNEFGESLVDIFRFGKDENGKWKNYNPNDKFESIVNTKWGDGSGAFNYEKTKFYYTNCDGDLGNFCHIYVTKLENGRWTGPFRLNVNVNQDEFDSQHPNLTKSGDTLFFVSNIPLGSQGGLDIWMSIDAGDDNWGPPINLGSSINTPFNETSPHYGESDNILFFSSDGHRGFGGFDIYFASGSTFKSADIYNVGFPYNSSKDDIFFFLANNHGFLTSNRDGGNGKFDIFSFSFETRKKLIDELATDDAIAGRNAIFVDDYNFDSRDTDVINQIISRKLSSAIAGVKLMLTDQQWEVYNALSIDDKERVEKVVNARLRKMTSSTMRSIRSEDDFYYEQLTTDKRKKLNKVISDFIEQQDLGKSVSLGSDESFYLNLENDEREKVDFLIGQRLQSAALAQLDPVAINSFSEEHLDEIESIAKNYLSHKKKLGNLPLTLDQKVFINDKGKRDIGKLSVAIREKLLQMSKEKIYSLSDADREFYQQLDANKKSVIKELASNFLSQDIDNFENTVSIAAIKLYRESDIKTKALLDRLLIHQIYNLAMSDIHSVETLFSPEELKSVRKYTSTEISEKLTSLKPNVSKAENNSIQRFVKTVYPSYIQLDKSIFFNPIQKTQVIEKPTFVNQKQPGDPTARLTTQEQEQYIALEPQEQRFFDRLVGFEYLSSLNKNNDLDIKETIKELNPSEKIYKAILTKYLKGADLNEFENNKKLEAFTYYNNLAKDNKTKFNKLVLSNTFEKRNGNYVLNAEDAQKRKALTADQKDLLASLQKFRNNNHRVLSENLLVESNDITQKPVQQIVLVENQKSEITSDNDVVTLNGSNNINNDDSTILVLPPVTESSYEEIKIKGTLVNNNKKPVQNTIVNLITDEPELLNKETITDTNGNFTFEVPNSNYRLQTVDENISIPKFVNLTIEGKDGNNNWNVLERNINRDSVIRDNVQTADTKLVKQEVVTTPSTNTTDPPDAEESTSLAAISDQKALYYQQLPPEKRAEFDKTVISSIANNGLEPLEVSNIENNASLDEQASVSKDNLVSKGIQKVALFPSTPIAYNDFSTDNQQTLDSITKKMLVQKQNINALTLEKDEKKFINTENKQRPDKLNAAIRQKLFLLSNDENYALTPSDKAYYTELTPEEKEAIHELASEFLTSDVNNIEKVVSKETLELFDKKDPKEAESLNRLLLHQIRNLGIVGIYFAETTFTPEELNSIDETNAQETYQQLSQKRPNLSEESKKTLEWFAKTTFAPYIASEQRVFPIPTPEKTESAEETQDLTASDPKEIIEISDDDALSLQDPYYQQLSPEKRAEIDNYTIKSLEINGLEQLDGIPSLVSIEEEESEKVSEIVANSVRTSKTLHTVPVGYSEFSPTNSKTITEIAKKYINNKKSLTSLPLSKNEKAFIEDKTKNQLDNLSTAVRQKLFLLSKINDYKLTSSDKTYYAGLDKSKKKALNELASIFLTADLDNYEETTGKELLKLLNQKNQQQTESLNRLLLHQIHNLGLASIYFAESIFSPYELDLINTTQSQEIFQQLSQMRPDITSEEKKYLEIFAKTVFSPYIVTGESLFPIASSEAELLEEQYIPETIVQNDDSKDSSQTLTSDKDLKKNEISTESNQQIADNSPATNPIPKALSLLEEQQLFHRLIAFNYLNANDYNPEKSTKDKELLKKNDGNVLNYATLFTNKLKGYPINKNDKQLYDEGIRFYAVLPDSSKYQFKNVVLSNLFSEQNGRYVLEEEDEINKSNLDELKIEQLNSLNAVDSIISSIFSERAKSYQEQIEKTPVSVATLLPENETDKIENFPLEEVEDDKGEVNIKNNNNYSEVTEVKEVVKDDINETSDRVLLALPLLNDPLVNEVELSAQLADGNGQPITFYPIVLRDNYDLNIIAEGYTDQNGFFSFKVPKKGYIVDIGKKEEVQGYRLVDINIERIQKKPQTSSSIVTVRGYFDHAGSKLRQEAKILMNDIVSAYKKNPTKIIIESNTDDIGNERNNLELSKKRAYATFNFLVNAGVKKSDIAMLWLGQNNPISSNNNPFGRQLNRRVDVSFEYDQGSSKFGLYFLVRPRVKLKDIAKELNTDIEKLKSLNGLENEQLTDYQPIRVLEVNELPDPELIVPANIFSFSSKYVYSVKKNDDLTSLSLKFNVPEELIVEFNNLEDSQLKEGDKLIIYPER